MNITVLAKLVPDLVEELSIDEQGKALDLTWLRLKLNEFDDHAIEQAIVLKEQYGAHVTVMIPDQDGADDALYSAAAKGSDHLVKLSGDFTQGMDNHALARAVTDQLQTQMPDLLLTGVQAHNDLDGAVGPLLAGALDLPYIGYVSGIRIDDEQAIVRKEYPGGLVAEMAVTLPAVLGIQAASRPLSYVAFSKIRQAMKTATIDEMNLSGQTAASSLLIERMFKPEGGERATMFTGSVEEVASRIVETLQQRGIL